MYAFRKHAVYIYIYNGPLRRNDIKNIYCYYYLLYRSRVQSDRPFRTDATVAARTVIEQLTALQRFSVARKMNSRIFFLFSSFPRVRACRFSHSTNVIYPYIRAPPPPTSVRSRPIILSAGCPRIARGRVFVFL